MQSALRERDRALTAVARCLDGAHAGRGSALFILGEAGLGKTSLLDHARAAAAVAGIDLATGRGEQMERALPFGVLVQALSDFEAGDVVDVLTGVAPAVEPAAPFYRTLRWLRERGPRPLLVTLDDLQWSDADSLSLLAFLVRRVSQLPVAFVGTLRPWPAEAYDCVRLLVEAGDATLERLRPLTRPAAARLLTDRTGEAASETAERHSWELCRGNPLLLEQVAIALQRGDPVPAAAGTAGQLADFLLLARFAGLDRPGLACAQAACVLGTSFSPPVVAEVAGLDEPEVAAAVEALWHSGLILEADAGAMQFTHPLFAQALYADISPPARRVLHRRCFEVLATRGLDAEASEHAARADLVGDERAVAVLTRAGQTASRAGAVAVASRAFELAVRLSGGRGTPQLLLASASALAAAGAMKEAADACRDLLDHAGLGWAERVETLRLLGRSMYLTGAADHGDAALSEAVDIAVAHDPSVAVQPLLDLSLAAWLGGGTARALPIATRARELAVGSDRVLHQRAEAVWGHLALEGGDANGLGATAAVGASLLEAGAPPLDPAELIWPWASIYHHAMNANYAEGHDQAVGALERAQVAAERAGAASAMAIVSIFLADVQMRRGHLSAALAEAGRARELADVTPGVMPYADVAGAEALLWLGQAEESERLCLRAEAGGFGQWFVRLWVAHIRGLRLLWAGDPAASTQFLETEMVTNSVGIREPCHLQWAGHAVAAHLAVDRVDDACRVVEWLESCAASLPCRWPAGAAALGRARLTWHEGDDDAAEGHFLRALDLLGEGRLPVQRAEALLAYGSFLRRRGRPADARAHLAEAVALTEAAGAATLAAAGRSELAAAGGRRRNPGPTADRLTPAERRVSELAAAGHSNADIGRTLFLSVNTVETHLKRVYTKLGIRSRRQLMTRQAVSPPDMP